MGAKFSPSVTNLYMAKWEEEVVLYDQDPRILLNKRFIDDILLIWSGTNEDVEGFLQSMNDNDRNITLSWDISKDNIHFLDLEIENPPPPEV